MEYLACICNASYLNWPYIVVTSVEEGLNQVIFALIFVPSKTNNVFYDIIVR